MLQDPRPAPGLVRALFVWSTSLCRQRSTYPRLMSSAGAARSNGVAQHKEGPTAEALVLRSSRQLPPLHPKDVAIEVWFLVALITYLRLRLSEIVSEQLSVSYTAGACLTL